MTTITTALRRILWITGVIAAASTIRCDPSSSPTSASTARASSSPQQWDFVLWEGDLDSPVSAGLTTCSPPAGVGTGSCGPVVWTLLRASEFGCTLKVSFEPVFSVNTVTFANWRAPAAGSTCSSARGFSHQGGGSVADPPYGTATTAGGQVTITWSTPIGPGGGTAKWTAIRGMCSDCPRN